MTIVIHTRVQWHACAGAWSRPKKVAEQAGERRVGCTRPKKITSCVLATVSRDRGTSSPFKCARTPELQARHGCEVCSYVLKQTDAPTVVDKRHAAPLISQRGAWQTRAALKIEQKSDGWKY